MIRNYPTGLSLPAQGKWNGPDASGQFRAALGKQWQFGWTGPTGQPVERIIGFVIRPIRNDENGNKLAAILETSSAHCGKPQILEAATFDKMLRSTYEKPPLVFGGNPGTRGAKNARKSVPLK
jgi:hypothetical protein